MRGLCFLSPLQSLNGTNEGYPNILDGNGPVVLYNLTAVKVSGAKVPLRDEESEDGDGD